MTAGLVASFAGTTIFITIFVGFGPKSDTGFREAQSAVAADATLTRTRRTSILGELPLLSLLRILELWIQDALQDKSRWAA